MTERQLTILMDRQEQKRAAFGREKLVHTLWQSGGFSKDVKILPAPLTDDMADYRLLPGEKLWVGTEDMPFAKWLEEQELLVFHDGRPEGEGFYIQTVPGHLTVVVGGSDTGALYGCLHLSERVLAEGQLPEMLAYGDHPQMVLRGPALGLQKTKIEPPRLTYEYPITPERFPWFYDRGRWIRLLDRLLELRCNVLYLWSGHPFSSLVRLKEYPEALEVTEEEYEQNHETFLWLSRECDKRGIWIVLKFYNIHIPLPFARAHHLEQLQSSIDPLVADYTRASIAEFIRSYPNVGLMVCLGEALRGKENKTKWFTDTILPGVKQGIEEAGLTQKPPVILRGHDCDPVDVLTKSKEIYDNLYTMWKYNGESLTTYLPRGKWREQHLMMSSLSGAHIINVHILANLEPFRFCAPLYIQKCVQASRYRLNGNALHLYPLFYWDWPYSPDRHEPLLEQIDRDWIWYQAWFRYAWQPKRDEQTEVLYWQRVLAEHYQLDIKEAGELLRISEKIFTEAPRLLGRIGITEGNRQTWALGMTMSELTNAVRYRPNAELWKSVACQGERLEEFACKEEKKQKHLGETPDELAGEIEAEIAQCRDYLQKMDRTHCTEEMSALLSDMEAICELNEFYCHRIRAAIHILFYKSAMDENCGGDGKELQAALAQMEKSVQAYRRLTVLTQKTYRFANSMQTRQRKIPFPDGEKYSHFKDCLPEYERELENFRRNITALSEGRRPSRRQSTAEVQQLQNAPFQLLQEKTGETAAECFKVAAGEKLFTDCDWTIRQAAPQLEGLTGIRVGLGQAISGAVKIRISLQEDSSILLGYFDAKGVEWLPVPDLETNTHADDRGGLAVIYRNAVSAAGCPMVSVHALKYEKGIHELFFGNGGFVIVGIVSAATELVPCDIGFSQESLQDLDWLYGDVRS